MEDLVSRVAESGFFFDVTGPAPQLVRTRGGAKMPPALLEEVRVNRGELLAYLKGGARESSDPEEEGCRLCGADVSDPELRARLADPAFCDRGGAKAVTNKLTGEPIHAAEPRCPYKPPRA